MSSLVVDIQHRFPGFELDVAFASPLPGTTVLFGPSGSGKSTVASAIAGLLRPDRGSIALGDTILFCASKRIFTPPHHRGLGVVFQDARLFPHMNVATNLRYGARRARGRGIGFDDVVSLLALDHLLARSPKALSGGERQRVAIGRALLAQPRLLLMDEPLASLDPARKLEILPYLGRLKDQLGLPIIYVTHAMDEVARLADTLVLIDKGGVVAAGEVADLTSRGELPLARRDDAAAILSMRVAAHDRARALTLLAVGGIELWVPFVDAIENSAIRVSIPAREVILATSIPEGISVHNVIACKVDDVTDDPSRHAAIVELIAGKHRLLALVTPDAIQSLAITPGRSVFALIKSMSIDVIATS